MYAISRRTARFLPILVLLTSLAAARGLVDFTGSTDALARLFPFKCPLRATTGIRCPTCGLGHALIDAWIGRWKSSLNHHPLGLVVLIVFSALSLFYLVRPESTVSRIKRVGDALTERPRLLFGALVFYLLIGLVRAVFHVY